MAKSKATEKIRTKRLKVGLALTKERIKLEKATLKKAKFEEQLKRKRLKQKVVSKRVLKKPTRITVDLRTQQEVESILAHKQKFFTGQVSHEPKELFFK